MNANSMSFRVAVLLVASLACTPALASKRSDFERARAADTIEAYEALLAKYPRESRSLREEIDLLRAWQAAQATNTAAGYEDFLRKYGYTRFAEPAKAAQQLAVEAAAWNEAAKANTVRQYKYFEVMHKNNRYVPESVARRKALEAQVQARLDAWVSANGTKPLPVGTAMPFFAYPECTASVEAIERANTEMQSQFSFDSRGFRDQKSTTVEAQPGISFLRVRLALDCPARGEPDVEVFQANPLLAEQAGGQSFPLKWSSSGSGIFSKLSVIYRGEVPRDAPLTGRMGPVTFAIPAQREASASPTAAPKGTSGSGRKD